MSIKISISTTEEGEMEEILDALRQVVFKRGCRIKRKPVPAERKKFLAYVETRKHSCQDPERMV